VIVSLSHAPSLRPPRLVAIRIPTEKSTEISQLSTAIRKWRRAGPRRVRPIRAATRLVASHRLVVLCLPRVVPSSVLADPELAEQRLMATKPTFRHLAHGLFKLRATNRHEAAISTQHGLG
jgi:hypothetical protein